MDVRLVNHLLTFILVALAPVVSLAVNGAVKSLLALGAPLVLDRVTLWGGAEAAQVLSDDSLVPLIVVNGRLELFLLLEPLLRGVVHPRVQDGDSVSHHFLRWLLLRTKSIEQVVLGLNSNHIVASFEELGQEVNGIASNLLLLIVALLSLQSQIVLQSPHTSVTEDGSQVSADGADKVFMVEAYHLLDKVLSEDAKHPDLLIGHSAALSLVHAVLSQGSHEAGFHVVDHRLM